MQSTTTTTSRRSTRMRNKKRGAPCREPRLQAARANALLLRRITQHRAKFPSVRLGHPAVRGRPLPDIPPPVLHENEVLVALAEPLGTLLHPFVRELKWHFSTDRDACLRDLC